MCVVVITQCGCFCICCIGLFSLSLWSVLELKMHVCGSRVDRTLYKPLMSALNTNALMSCLMMMIDRKSV